MHSSRQLKHRVSIKNCQVSALNLFAVSTFETTINYFRFAREHITVVLILYPTSNHLYSTWAQMDTISFIDTF